MSPATRYCVYVGWLAPRTEDSALAGIGADVIPDDADSETCVYWDERRDDVLVLSWNLAAKDEADAARLASDAVTQAVEPVIAGRLGDVTVYPLDDEDE